MTVRALGHRRGWTLLAILVLTVPLALTSCSSDESNPVGVGLGTAGLDTLLQEFELSELVHLGRLDIVDPSRPLDQADVLYIGERLGDASSFLVNFDFADETTYQYVFGEDEEEDISLARLEEIFAAADTVRGAALVLQAAEWYQFGHGAMGDEENQRPWPDVQKDFDVHRLIAPFDTLTFPAAEPEFEATDLTGASLEIVDSFIPLTLPRETVESWVFDERSEVGLIVRDNPAAGADTELVGLVSRESGNFEDSLLELNRGGTQIGPTIRIELRSDEFVYIRPVADVSTWHQLSDLPTSKDDDIVLRSQLISGVVLRFDLESLPERVRINRANLVLHVDTARTFGPSTRLELDELPTALAPDSTRTLVIGNDIVAEAEYLSDGILDPEHLSDHTVRLDLSSTVQRFINGLPGYEVGYLLTYADACFPASVTSFDSDGVAFDSAVSGSLPPDVFFQRWTFFGTGAVPELRPRLEVLYTRINEITDGGEQ